MKLRNLIAVLMLAAGVPATADVVTVVDAVETTTSNINFPVSNNGRLLFKPCAGTCSANFVSARLTPETRFAINGAAVEFDDFRKQFLNIRPGTDTYALVSYDTRSNTVTSVQIAN
ncbi:MAG: hypothetical protein OEW68_14935 [Gammaproteobacteria bacterium]|nr:hypothetical protein [Gammaproteobacteria bacterium]MDH4316126.1 hypothetical protein [Gammaproteobacteria bacterium]MDH5214951.1 hypothetical protein [Gammaproteobacteria bacterium]MDH5499627.1 hypothetical protein [Gammaproteobacteria bacterium]